MKRNTSFARNIIANCEGTPQLQKIELKRQKKNYSISQAIMDYNMKKVKIRQSSETNNNYNSNNTNNHSSSSNIFSNSNYNTFNTNNNSNKKNDYSYISINDNSILNSNSKSSKNKIPMPISFNNTKNISKIPTSRTQIVSTGENININLLEINPKNSNEKSFSFKLVKNNEEKIVDILNIKLGIIRFNLLVNYISTCLNIFNDYKKILKQPIIKTIQNYENSILIQKELLKMKKYIYDYINNLPKEKKTMQINDYLKFLEKEINEGKKIGIESDIYEINYIFNFFPKGIEINFDYDAFELIYYNSKKNNKISGKAMLPPPELYFKLSSDKFDIKFFEFEVEIEDFDDVKYILLRIYKIIQDKINIAKIFLEPCLSNIRQNLEEKNNLKESIFKAKKKNKINAIENIKTKNKNNIYSINTKSNTSEMTLNNKNNKEINVKSNTIINANNINNNINIKEIIVNKKNNTYTNDDLKKEKIPFLQRNEKNKKLRPHNSEVDKMKNILSDLDDEKSQKSELTEIKNDFFKDENDKNSNSLILIDDINNEK